jgi:hypothetical protein
MKRKDHVFQENPHLKETFLKVVSNQLRLNDPPETRQTLDRLTGKGVNGKDARLLIASAIAAETQEMLAKQEVFNRERFAQRLAALDKEP